MENSMLKEVQKKEAEQLNNLRFLHKPITVKLLSA